MGVISPVATDTNGNPITEGANKVLGKDDFLELLVAKLTHQDPLNPLEDEQFVAQLAQFSSLEQLQNVNESLGQSLEWDYLQMQTINNTMATSLIGKEVKAVYGGVYLNDDNQPQVNFTNDTYAAEVAVKITDADGNLVRSLTGEAFAPGTNHLVWDGLDQNGTRLPAGYYSVAVTAYDANGDAFEPSTFLQGKVEGISYLNGSAYLKVEGLEIPLADVSSINEYREE